MKLAGQVAIVTGAGRGIGREIALAQAREGARVALVARSEAQLDEVAAAIAAQGGTAAAHSVDIRDLAAVERACAAIAAELGPPDLLVNNAGAFRAIGPIWEVDPDAWWGDVETNLRGTFNFCRAVLPGMLARKSGRIVNFCGGGTAGSFPMGSGYGTSKAGVLRFTECLNDSLSGTGVRAFGLDPGLVRTAMTEYQLTSKAGQTHLPRIDALFRAGIDVPPTRAARLAVEIAQGRFDAMAGRMLMAARGDIGLTEANIADILARDLRSLRVNGIPEEKPNKGED
jgi:NAD(P)-dependent dehydrogenase (short-subunit alcohol dehydrogenase family)